MNDGAVASAYPYFGRKVNPGIEMLELIWISAVQCHREFINYFY